MASPLDPEMNLENPLVSLEWSHYTTLPVGMQHVQAVVVDDKVYVGGGMTTDPEMETNIYVFDHTIESPTVTPIPTQGPTRWSTLATIHSRLVLAGGAIDRTNATNEIWALNDDGCTWNSQAFPEMPQACWGAAALSTNNHLILAGGVENHPSQPLDTVQIYNVNSKQWALAQPLPTSCYFMKGVLHNGNWYLAGGRWQYHEIFHASIESLIATSEGKKEDIWITDLPKFSRQCCSISVYLDQLIAIGGMMNGGQVDSIQKYSFNKQRWVDVGLLDQPSDSACTVILPSKELLLIGGNIEGTYHKFSDSVSKSNIKVFRSLDDSFTQYAFAKIEIAAGIPIYNSIACGEMNANAAELLEATTGQPEQKTADGSSRDVIRKWLDGKSESTTWRVLLELFRELKMEGVADKIQHLFTDKEAYRYKQIGYLRGVDIIGQTAVVVTNESQSFHWAGYGMKLHVPSRALPEGTKHCQVEIKASLSGQFEFPKGRAQSSAVYWLSSPVKFMKPLTLDVQYCTKYMQGSNLSFAIAKCTQRDLPYQFQNLKGGKFTQYSSYGSIELSQFSGVGVTDDESVDRRYCANIYYLGSKVNWLTDFVITWNMEICITVVSRNYAAKSAIEGPDQEVEFASDRITLDVPMEGVAVEGWNIRPLIVPTIMKRRVDEYNGGQRIPSCRLRVKWKRDGCPSDDLCHVVKLEGAKEPFNFLTIESDPLPLPAITEAESTIQPGQFPKLLLAKPEEVQQMGLSLQTYQEGYLRGVDVIGETSLIVTNESQSFYWRGYGLKLHIPKGALPENESMCTISIKVGISGQFQIHPSHTLASAVYWLYSTVKKFSKFLTLEVQHCSQSSQSSRLSFVVAKCSQKELPYTFKPLQGGVFPPEGSYGRMELDHFSGYTIVQEGAGSLWYCGRLFYQGGRTNRRVDFVITPNLEAHLTNVTSTYANSIRGPDQQIEFQTDRITLDIPIPGVTLHNGWTITPLFHPTILKKEVDDFKQGRRIPSCQLSVQWQGAAPATDLPFCHPVNLQGAKEPFDYLVIESDPAAELIPETESMKPTKPVPTPKELMTALHHKVADKWKAIGTHLEISQETLAAIAETELHKPHACLMEMLNVWRKRVEPPATWSAIIEAVRFLGNEQLAMELAQKYCQV